ncbi:MAG: hypothetical protein K2X26_06925 [Chitinophagaceae bacterium]|nr:hypothetical protein [Chitinophagaceae bacterium]
MGLIASCEWLFHPFIVPIYAIRSWLASLWASRILFFGRWSSYHGFHAQNAINSLFYRTQWINIDRYGRNGESPIIGIGNYPIANWWHLSSIASYLYSYAGAFITLIGSLIMITSHFLWIQQVSLLWVIIIIVILTFSSSTIMATFHKQNYQILSWMWLPSIMYAINNEYLLLATFLIGCASIFGITVIVLLAPIVLGQSIITNNTYLVVIMIPAILIKLLNFIPVIMNTGMKQSIGMIGKMVGFVYVDVKYKRKSMRFNRHHLYFLLLYSIVIICYIYAYNEIPFLILIAYSLFFINQLFIRFADDQSVILFFVLIVTFELITHRPNFIASLGFLVIANPRPNYLEIGSKNQVRKYKPFNVDPLLENMEIFLKVPVYSKILFAFDDPQGEYEKIFDGYRIMLEAPLVVATKNKIHLFPDWWAVAQTNYNKSPNIWGRTRNDVISNMEYWKADFVIIYQDTKTELDKTWEKEFQIISEFDWGEAYPDFLNWELIRSTLSPPKWWLLKRKA